MDERERQKIIHMIGLLGSDNDAEVLAAARAIKRVLESAKLSFGDLKAALATVQIREVVVVEPRNRLLDLAEELYDASDRMSEHERRFVRQMWVRMSADDDFEMSEKQENWFYIIIEKYGVGPC